MEKPTYTAIDYNSKENRVIEERIRNYYLLVKNTLYGRLNISDSPRGLCADLIDVSRTISREFALFEKNLPMEKDEMAIKIHDIQRMIISRPGFRMNKEKFRDYGEG